MKPHISYTVRCLNNGELSKSVVIQLIDEYVNSSLKNVLMYQGRNPAKFQMISHINEMLYLDQIDINSTDAIGYSGNTISYEFVKTNCGKNITICQSDEGYVLWFTTSRFKKFLRHKFKSLE